MYKIPIILFCLLLCFTSCDEEDGGFSPKPKGYYRITFPEKKYVMYDSACPYRFEIPEYSKPAKASAANEPCNFNLEFPQFKATVHIGYRPVNNNIAQYIEDAHYFANKHQVKATGLDETLILRDSAKVYGLLFDIAGNAASSLQFYITDSTKHFLRGALYFNSVPNIDSLKIVVDFIRNEMLHLINTASWKEGAGSKIISKQKG
jgi:gliding motility-associated lipoprotein GldD